MVYSVAGAVNLGYTLGAPNATCSRLVRPTLPYKRSFPSRKLLSIRVNHWNPLRGSVSEKVPLKVNGRLHGSWPTGVSTRPEGPPGAPAHAPTLGTTPAVGPA